MRRRAALVGTNEGHWIRTADMRPLRLRAKVRAEVMVKIEQRVHDQASVESCVRVGPGLHSIPSAVWTRLLIADGPYIDALCLLEGN